MALTKKVEVYLDDDMGPETEEVEFPASWVVCWDCRGEGSKYLGITSSEQPSFTQSDREREGPDFMEDYMSGKYDRPCPTCKGRTTVLEVIEPAKDTEFRVRWELWQEQLKGAAECDAIQQAEMAAERAFERRLGYG